MQTKEFIDPRQLLLDSFRLARQVHDSGFIPDMLIVVWRGGAPMGLAIHEFFQYRGIVIAHTVLRVASYRGIAQRSEVEIENIMPVLALLPPDAKVLVIDDIFDSGNTLNRICELLWPRSRNIRLATVFYKPGRTRGVTRPDYYIHTTDKWLVFPHELDGLTDDELHQKDPEIASLVGRTG
jgi:hypoxanthine phosphoribosyltransferase